MHPAVSALDQFRSADQARALQMVLRMGTVYEVDHTTRPPRARVESGGLITNFLPFPQAIGANFRAWHPARVGTQVLLASPSGDTRQGVIVATYNTEAIEQPEEDDGTDLILFNDGTEIRKNGEALTIAATVPVVITAPVVTINGEVF